MYQKEIIYIGLYKDGNRMGGAGFLRVENKEEDCRLCLKAQNVPLGISGKFPVRIYNGSGWQELNGVTIQDGKGDWENRLSGRIGQAVLQIMLPGGYALEGRSKEAERGVAYVRSESQTSQTITVNGADDRRQREAVSGADDKRQGEAADKRENEQQEAEQVSAPVIVTEELPGVAYTNIDVMPIRESACTLKEDKWEQIMDTYEKIHPYGDERVYVKLEPKDFVILQAKYQHLVNNSFLLHGFYNYRYVILGKEQDYYLGVPGVFYEREKMVALMFGFEAFECPGGIARQGEFGYYLRKVEL